MLPVMASDEHVLGVFMAVLCGSVLRQYCQQYAVSYLTVFCTP